MGCTIAKSDLCSSCDSGCLCRQDCNGNSRCAQDGYTPLPQYASECDCTSRDAFIVLTVLVGLALGALVWVIARRVRRGSYQAAGSQPVPQVLSLLQLA